MITRTHHHLQYSEIKGWQEQLREAIRDPEVLLERLQLPKRLLAAATQASQQFPLVVPEAFIQKMRVGDINDPLLKQVLPIQSELVAEAGFSKDPVGEQNNTQAGLIQKYHGRVLLMVNGHCAINCRYCFRRHFPYQDNKLSRNEWRELIESIAADTSVSEVIYSGGDPLASNDNQLAWLTQQIAAIPHIKRLRIHSRLPVVIPARINEDCLSWLTQTSMQTVFVMHINHANEIDNALSHSITLLKEAGITVLNQSVLLRGVNDDPTSLANLSEALFENGVLPYYLHQLDKVAGAAHFAVSETDAKRIHQTLQSRLPGYLVPKLVAEYAGEASKTPL